MSALVEGFSGGGGSKIINSVEQEFYANYEDVEPNMFVEKVSVGIGIESTQKLFEHVNYKANLSVCKLTNTRIAIVAYEDNRSLDNGIRCAVYDIGDSSLEQVKITNLGKTSYAAECIRTVKLTESKFVLCVRLSSIAHVYVITIASDGTATIGTCLSLSDCCRSDVCAIDSSKFLFTHVNKSGYFRAGVYSVSGMTVTPGNSVDLIDVQDYAYCIHRTCRLTNNRFVSMMSYSSSYYWTYVTFDISGTNVSLVKSAGRAISFNTNRLSGLVKLDDEHLICVNYSHNEGEWQYSVAAIFEVASDGTVSVKSKLKLSDTNAVLGLESEYPGLTELNPDRITCIVYQQSPFDVTALKVNEANTQITELATKPLVTDSNARTKPYLFYDGVKNNFSMLWESYADGYVKDLHFSFNMGGIQKSKTKIDGVSKSKATRISKGKVLVLGG